ncbi:MAG: amidohydrolase family protein, partial [Thermodesulfobacteriota bacterium]|nr:amidohydrolase family protein [Thermodesulfobacteriota bacterium]
MFDFIIKNGTVIDGSGNKEKLCDIGIQGEKVKEIGILPKDKAKKYIDAKGKIVCPGFIDIHSHSDFTVLADPNSESKVFQGITTEVNGNCGVSGAPLYGKALEKRLSTLKNLNLKLRWNTIDEYFDLIFTQKKTINFATFIGHGNVRGSVLGYENRKATKDETKDMERLLSESLKKDAWGFSSGLIYPPGIYAAKKELIALARVASNYGGIYASHIRSEGDEIIPAVKESIEIVKKAEVPLLISHLKILHKRNWEKISEVIGIIEKGRESGLIINADCYPYNASSTELDSLLPHWCYGGGDKELFFRLKDPSTSLKIERELNGLEDKEENFWKNVLISGVHTEKNKYLTGRSLKSIADELNISPPKMLI